LGIEVGGSSAKVRVFGSAGRPSRAVLQWEESREERTKGVERVFEEGLVHV
jgi:hypothetical protein